MSKAQATGKDVPPSPKATGGQGSSAANAGAENDMETLTNALRLEREKNEVLLNEVVVLEDELVNRQLADFESVVSDETRDFWREQLLSNREAALGALAELAHVKAEREPTPASGHPSQEGTRRRPLHNRQTARPVPPGQAHSTGSGQAGQAGDGENTAVKIRNRAHELSKAERIPFSTAFRRAEKEIVGE